LKILVSNDDGVYADGLWALVKELRDLGNITVVAPDRDQSGVGTSVTLRHPLRLKGIRAPVEDVDAYLVEGTPADAVIMAVRQVMGDGVDLVVSGINEGPNLGDDVFVSGTVGAAMQAHFYGIPALAFSLAAYDGTDFSLAADLARLLVSEINHRALPPKLLLNVNLPNVPRGQIAGIEVTKLGEREYADNVEPRNDVRRQYFWIRRGKPQWLAVPGTDIWAIEQNRISITPLPPNNGNIATEHFLHRLAPEIFRKLSSGSLVK